MTALPLQKLIRRLHRVVAEQPGDNADAELLERFVRVRDDTAFELLVWRHGGMVLNLCRRMLRHEQDAEDAFQATFLALAREAAAVGRREALAGWLYRVAFRIALKIRSKANGRRSLVPVGDRPASSAPVELEWSEVRGILDEEVRRLPGKYRLPFVLCCLEGRSNTDAAGELGCPRGTVDSRLSWAKQRLRQRLAQRGVTLTTGAVALDLMLEANASGTAPSELVKSTVQASWNFVFGPAAGAMAAPVALARGVLHAMFIDRMKRAVFAVLAVAVLGGLGLAGYSAQAGDPQKKSLADQPIKDETQKGAAAAPRPAERGDAGQKDAAKPALLTNHQIREQLRAPAKLDAAFENVPLRDILEYVSDRYNMPVRIDHVAFARIGFKNTRDILDTSVTIAKARGVTFDQLLREALAQFDPSNAYGGLQLSLRVKNGQLMIVPYFSATDDAVVYNEEAQPPGASVSLFGEDVQISAAEKPLTEVLRELAEVTGANIIVDARAKEKARAPVSANLQDAPLMTAVRVLADMAELKAVALDNILYVTTRDNAERLLKEHEAAEKQRKVVPKRQGNPGM